MKRTKPNYIKVRIKQLKEELTKPNTDYDKVWYNRLIQELDWAHQMSQGKVTKNCYQEVEGKNYELFK